MKNAEVVRRTDLSHIGEIVQRRRHSLFGHIVRMDPLTPAHMALELWREIFDGSPGAGGLEETPGAPSHNMVRPDAE